MNATRHADTPRGSIRRYSWQPFVRGTVVMAIALSALAGCSSTLVRYDRSATPVVTLPLTLAGIDDARGRFREIFCAVLDARGATLPDYESCDSALVAVGNEPDGTGAPVELGPAGRPLFAGIVPGIGWGCFRSWLEPMDTVAAHLRRFGFDSEVVEVDALSSSATNAGQVRRWVLEFASANPDRELVLVGYSKGATDILEALVAYPEIVEHVAAVVTMAGSVGGSPLAYDARQSQLELLTHWPDADCDGGDGKGLESLTPAVRQAWLAEHPLPRAIPFYSLTTFPEPDRISRVLKGSYRKLARIDGRNDGQVIFDDQVVPGSTLIGFVNADHWAITVPIARSHSTLGKTFVNHNNYPREALAEAILRFLEEELSESRNAPDVRN